MKPIERTYPTATKVNVLSSEIYDNIEADVFHRAESSTKVCDMVSKHSLYRSLRQWYDMKWNLYELGRYLILSLEYSGTRQRSQGLGNCIREVGLTNNTLRLGEPTTWGSSKQYKVCFNI